jgi:hypothetical protein
VKGDDMKKRILGLSIALALVAILVAPLAAFAADTVISGNVVAGYSFTPPGAISLGNMTPGSTATGNNSGSLNGNNSNGYTVTAIDTKTPNTGYMVSGANVMQNKFKIGATAPTVDTADSARTLLNTSGPGTDTVPLFVSQQVSFSDPLASGYSITITYTVTPK